MNPSLSTPVSQTNGQRPQRNIPLIKKKVKAADPLFGPKKKPSFKPTTSTSKTPSNGAPVLVTKPEPVHPPAPLVVKSRAGAPAARNGDKAVSGFSDPNGTIAGLPYRDYKVTISKQDLVEGMRFHGLQFSADKAIDIRNEADFTRPVRLHRRDPRSTIAEQPSDEKGQDTKGGMDVEEKEELDKRKEARRQEREANLAQVAPSVDSGKRATVISKKTAQVYSRDYTVEQRRKMQNNYEERLPWHIDDFDNKHCYVGSNQAGSANTYAAFVHEQSMDGVSDRFRILPIEKLYQFKPRKTFRTMTIEEAENAMKKKGHDPQWLLDKRAANAQEAQLEHLARRGKAFFGTRDDTAAGRDDEGADLDFNVEEDFADDEEGDMLLAKDEDEKLAESRIKEDQLNANIFGIKEETEYDQAEARERREKERKKLISKGIRKALEKREKNFDHGSDSDDPFGSTSESEDTETERQRLEGEKKAKAEAESKRSGLSTGSNTPSGRKEKHGGPASDREGGDIRKSSSTKSLKRPGSPNLSDASGTDASVARKRKKNKHHLSSTQPTPNPSRPISPSNANVPPSSSAPEAGSSGSKLRGGLGNPQPSPAAANPGTKAASSSSTTMTTKPTKKRKSSAPGVGSAGSETDTAAVVSDAGAMSDRSRQQKRLKINPGANTSKSNDGFRSPQSQNQTSAQKDGKEINKSRAPSPRPPSTATAITATSTHPTHRPTVSDQPDPSTYPTPSEVYAAIPAAGITTKDLSNLFRNRYRKEDRGQMLARIKEVARFDTPSRLLFPGEGLKFLV